ncbi:MAG: hypothetical protein IKY12_01190 [Clostridia bacterium]|nr:hypothetical protein [Clostridia bacterium]
MRKSLIVCMTIILMLTVVPAFAADLDGIVFDDATATPAISVSGYPRFSALADGTLLLVNSGTVRKSTDNGATWKRVSITQNAATTVTTASGKTHELSRENWQSFVLEDGTVMVAYRSRTKGYESGEFYTSVRFMTSTDNAATFGNEVIVAEATTKSFHGYWEPFMIQPDENTVLIYYSDDLNVKDPNYQQNIVYHEYNLTTKAIGKSVVAINGASRNSRDGMPVITKLCDGGYAMVIETHDYSWRSYNGTYGKSVFVIGLSLSRDGKTWSAPVPVIAPENLTGGDRCAAPYITTLHDGRVIISYMTEDGYSGSRVSDPAHCNCVYGAAISDAPITVDTVLTATKGGAASGFTTLPDLFANPETGYMVWNTVERVGNYVYFAGSAGTNNGSESSSVKIRRANVSELVPDTDFDDDGRITVLDALKCSKAIVGGNGFFYDVNADGRADVLDLVLVIRDMLD